MITSVQAADPSFLESVLAIAATGNTIFPLAPLTKIPFKGSHGHLDATTNEAQIRKWWLENPNANIGLPCKANKVVVVDLDRHGADGPASFLTLPGYEPLPTTSTAITGDVDSLDRCGFHYLFEHPPDLDIRANLDYLFDNTKCNIDFKSNGYILVEPSVRKDGKRYKWLPGLSILEFKPAPFPGWLLKLAKQEACQGGQWGAVTAKTAKTAEAAEAAEAAPIGTPVSDSPWEDFQERGDWQKILAPLNLTITKETTKETRLRRQDSCQDSASILYDQVQTGILSIFTSKLDKLPAGNYVKPEVYARLHHNGNRPAAVKALLAQGFGKPIAPKPNIRKLTRIN